MAKQFKVFSILASLVTACHAFTTVGLTCITNSTCTGDSEYCYIRRDFEKPCEKGLCTCLPDYVFDGIKCTKRVFVKNLGDPCDLNDFGQYFGVPNADCYDSVVDCNPGYYRRGNSCLAETSCSAGRLCPTGMYCDNRQQCVCYYDKKFDLASQSCIKREFGDACRRDTDCQVQGRDFRGFTFRSSICLDGQCICGDVGQEAVATYIDRENNTYKTKTICVSPTATTNATQGTTCTLDPVYWSDISDTVVCDPLHVCFQCPDDYQYPDYGKNFFGRCRKLKWAPKTVKPAATPPPLPPFVLNHQTPAQNFGLSWNPNVEVVISYYTTQAPSTTEATTTSSTTTTSTTTTTPKVNLSTSKKRTGFPWNQGWAATRTSPSSNGSVESQTHPIFPMDPNIFIRRTTLASSPSTHQPMLILRSTCLIPRITHARYYASALNGSWVKVQALDSVMPGTHISLTCESGKAPTGGSSRSVCLIDGRWSDEFGNCSVVAMTTPASPLPSVAVYGASKGHHHSVNCAIPVVINGALSTNDSNIIDVYAVRPGSLLSLNCNPGYTVSHGSSESVCLTNGQWYLRLGVCSRAAPSWLGKRRH